MLSTEVYDRRMNQITNNMPIAFPDRHVSALLGYAERQGLRCGLVDGQWHFYKRGVEWDDHIQTYEKPAYSLLNWRHRARKRATSMTKFKIGDKVQLKINKERIVEVVGIKQAYTVKYEDSQMPSRAIWFEEELEPAKVKLTVEEAWAEVGAMMMDYVADVAGHLGEGDYSNIRNRAYVILGGNGIEVGRQHTEVHNALRHRLNVMIDRVIERFQRG